MNNKCLYISQDLHQIHSKFTLLLLHPRGYAIKYPLNNYIRSNKYVFLCLAAVSQGSPLNNLWGVQELLIPKKTEY